MLELSVILPRVRQCTQSSGVYRYTEKQLAQCKAAVRSTTAVEGIRLTQVDVTSIRAEGYHIQIKPSDIHIRYSTDSGKLYALRSLFLLFESTPSATLPCLDIEDYPEKSSRMFMLDISRNRIPNMTTLFALIDICCNLKLNELQLYNEHCFAYRGHDVVCQDATPYTEKDISAIQDYASERCIELVPNQNSYGHMERWLKHNPYRHLAEKEDGFIDPAGVHYDNPSTLCPILDESISFIDELYSQYLPLFTSKRVNIGGDEPWEHCMGKSKEAAARIGRGNVYLNYILELYKLVQRYDKSMQMWGDIIHEYPELIGKLPTDITLMEWGYEADHPFAERSQEYKSLGKKFYTISGTSSWNSIAGRISVAEKNIFSAVSAAEDCVGLTDWGDNGHIQQLPVSFPPLLFFASLAWAGTNAQPTHSELKTWLTNHLLYDKAATDALFTFSEIASGYTRGRVEKTKEESFLLANANIPAVAIIPRLWQYYPNVFTRQDYSLELEQLESTLDTLNNTGVWNAEILWTGKMLQHAFNNLQLRSQLAGQNSSTGRVVQPDMLLEDLQNLKDEFSRLWLLRSRLGGLQDSLKLFNELHTFYKELP